MSIIINDSIEYIKEFHKFEQNKKNVEIYLTDKNMDNNRNYYNDFNISHLFQECDSLYKIECDIKDFRF